MIQKPVHFETVKAIAGKCGCSCKKHGHGLGQGIK